ncbi:MAG: glutathione S-transferase N-terminal domain-containing protein [Gammaproteobacteria bacterium]|nr:glutathione S-transferase N-terminal domain-containing protein [Gammaproteobacteria bacterium]
MKLYYAPGACSLATHIVLEWTGKSYEAEKVSIHPKSENLLAVNPAGAVPVLEDDGWVLTQNSAILNYLADVYPEAKLGGDTPRARAEVNRWLGVINSEVHPAYKPFFGAMDYLGDKAAIEKVHENSRQAIRKNLERADKQLESHDWIAGECSVADAYLFVMLRWAKAQKIDLAGLDHVEAWFKRMSSDSAVTKVLREEGLD